MFVSKLFFYYHHPEGISVLNLWSLSTWRTIWRTRSIFSLFGLMLISTQLAALVNLGVWLVARTVLQIKEAVSWPWSPSRSKSISLAALCPRMWKVLWASFPTSSTGWFWIWETLCFPTASPVFKLHYNSFLVLYYCLIFDCPCQRPWLSGCRLQRLLQASGHAGFWNSTAPRTGLCHRHS